MIKSEVTNLRRFPVRRVDLQVGVAYREDLREVREVLLEVADRNPLCLSEPAPSVLFDGFADSSMNYQFRVWAKTENFLDLRNSIPVEIKEAFDEHGIEIPFPHRTLYTGSETAPFPVQHSGESTTPPEEDRGSTADVEQQ
jgi:small-conductance mechanosensitive channel